MKQITKYQACDGAEFESPLECIKHEQLLSEIEDVMKLLYEPPVKSTEFTQQTADRFYTVRVQLLQIAQRLSPHKWFEQSLEDHTIHPSWAGRIIGEVSHPLSRAWFRIMSTDKNLREWNQPYYANEQNKLLK